MNVVLKCSLLNGIDVVNNSDCDGVEVQLLNKENDFSVLDTIKKPIRSIHVDLPKKDSDTINGETMIDLRHWLLNDWDYFKELCKIATKYNAAIVIHAFYDYRKIKDDREFRVKIRLLDKLFPTIKICIENCGLVSYSERKDSEYATTEDIPKIVKYLNKYSKNNIFYPLLDICHYFQEFSSEIYYSPKPLADIIGDYQSDFQLIHFNYGLGDCMENRHSNNFEANKKLLKKLLSAIKWINDDSHLVLEIVEENYFTRPKMMKLFNEIKEGDI